MSSQNTQPASPAPGQFDFILKDSPKPPRHFPWSGLPKPAVLIAGVSLVLIIGILLFSLLFGKRVSNSAQLIDIMARAQEISRVSTLARQQATADDTKALALTTGDSLSSEKQEIAKYLKAHKIKTDPKKLNARHNKSTDDELQAASQNNNYDKTYLNYLKTNLADYSSALNNAYASAPKDLGVTLKEAYSSTQQILSAPQFK
ncbi:hypothetical protein HYW35_03485 [Candidatus Saccharibacteria bacterium]|nr:hypothetical protein [Candidatus Saccharibacteria bacterium]